MRPKLSILFICLFVFVLAGCQNSSVDNKMGGKNKFPPELAGTWRTDDGKWQMVFNPDGTLYSIKYYFNDKPMILSEGGGYDFFEDGSVRSVYFFGEHSVLYSPENSELKVEIAIEHFEMNRPGGHFEGSMMDKFTGEISADKKTWIVVWITQTIFKDLEVPPIRPRRFIFKHIEEIEPEQVP